MLRRIVLLAVAAAILAPAWFIPAAMETREALILLDTDKTEPLKTLEVFGAPVYYRAGGRILAGADEQALSELGDAATVLDREPWSDGTVYYWVMLRNGGEGLLPATEGVELLYRDGGTALVKALPEDAEQLALDGHELARVTRSPKIKAAPPSRTETPGTREFGGEIDDMVAAVNQLSYTSKLQILENFLTRYTYTTNCDQAADWIYGQFTGFGLDVERHEFTISSDTKENIIATLPGLLYPDEVVFIISHLDSTSDDPYNAAPGADDNGTGTATVIETARILAGYTFERTIIFACFGAEEQGLVGSGAYVADIAAAGMDVVACYNSEMLGWPGSDPAPPDLVIYTDPASTALAETLRDAALYYLPTQLEPMILHELLTASDHASFWNHGYQAIVSSADEAWGSDSNPYYHTTNDLVSNLDMGYATACTKATLAAVAATAVPFTPSGMRVSPAGGFVSEGPNGGPFTPQQSDYTLISFEEYPIDYTASVDASWLDLITGSGTIPALGTETVTVSINSGADSLSDGAYAAVIDFVNTTNHDGDTSCPVELTVGVPVVQIQWTMDTDPGWFTGGQWAYGQPTGGGGEYGNPDPTSGYTGSNAYGYNLAGDYPNNLSEIHLTAPAISCSNLYSVSLKFQRYLNVEQPAYDHAYVRVSTDGSTWTTVWQNTAEVADSAWTQVEYDISAVADGSPAVYLRWTMGSTDSAWRYSGWNIDDVEIWGIVGSSTPADTVAASLTCFPGSGTLPLTTEFTAEMENLTAESRRAAARIDLVIASGTGYTNWRSGWTNLAPSEVFSTSWNQNFPSLGSLVGDNIFTLNTEDVTPPPYNQPPYSPAGDTDTSTCTVTGVAP